MWKSRLEHSARKEILAYVGMHKKYFLDIFVDTGLGIAEDSSSIEEFRLSSYSPSVWRGGTNEVSDGVVVSALLKALWFCATSWDVRNALAGKSIRVNGGKVLSDRLIITISPE